MNKKSQYIQLGIALLVVGVISITLSAIGVGADALTNTVINAVGIVTIFGGVAIITALILFALAAAASKEQ